LILFDDHHIIIKKEIGREREEEAGRQGGREAGRQGGREAGREGGRESREREHFPLAYGNGGIMGPRLW
jgi:hypothetical protein